MIQSYLNLGSLSHDHVSPALVELNSCHYATAPSLNMHVAHTCQFPSHIRDLIIPISRDSFRLWLCSINMLCQTQGQSLRKKHSASVFELFLQVFFTLSNCAATFKFYF